MMGWIYAFQPVNEKSYKSSPAPKVMENNQGLILWTTLVIIHNVCTIKVKDGHS